MRSMLTLLLLFFLAGPVLSSDAVLEINQTCAVQTGCFSGDTAGLPVTITTQGSYRLTSDLSHTLRFGARQNFHFIEISVDHVALDLAGFSISCDALLGSCNGSGSGVRSTSGTEAISVRNGTIAGMAGWGVDVLRQAEITSIWASHNNSGGVRVGNDSTVSDNMVYQNENRGIQAGSGSTVSGNKAYFNGDDGISAGADLIGGISGNI